MMRVLAARFGVRLSGMVIQSSAQGEERALALERVELIRMHSKEDLQKSNGLREHACDSLGARLRIETIGG